MAAVLRSRHLTKKICEYSSICIKCKSDKFSIIRDFRKQLFQMNEHKSGPVTLSIERKLKECLTPTYLEVINESYQHNVPPGSETHFKVVVVSTKFNETHLIKRHRLVNEVLADELNSGVHALSIVAKTPSQWEKSDRLVEKSPACKGGFGK